MSRSRFRAVAFVVPVIVGLTTSYTAQACTVDGKPTALADGKLAVRVPSQPAAASARTWAPFAFPGRYHAGTLIRFAENAVARRSVLSWEAANKPWRWEFGDGTHATGWSVTHRYTHPGTYRITVFAYYPAFHRSYSFDAVQIVTS